MSVKKTTFRWKCEVWVGLKGMDGTIKVMSILDLQKVDDEGLVAHIFPLSHCFVGFPSSPYIVAEGFVFTWNYWCNYKFCCEKGF